MAALRTTLARYNEALVHKSNTGKTSKDLVSLDAWYRGELRDSLQTTKQLNLSQLEQLMQWKLARGKFRPTLIKLVRSNNPNDVERVTRAALEMYESSSPEKSLDELCKLKGVGPATASAVLAAWKPAVEPFLSDESMNSLDLAREYTKKAWLAWRAAMTKRLEQCVEEDGWTMDDLERAMYAEQVLKGSTAGEPSLKAAKRKPTDDGGSTSRTKTKKPKKT